MNKKNNNKGFTLAELLIVVAIIAVLVAIAIPVFTQQLEKSREATDLANVRSAYASLVVGYLENGQAANLNVEVKQKVDKWQSSSNSDNYTLSGFDDNGNTTIDVPAKTSGNYIVSISADGGTVSVS